MATTILLTPQQVLDLRNLCNDPFRELGSMMRPEHMKCEVRHTATKHRTFIIKFPSDQAAEKWNSIQEKTILRNGHFATAAVTVGVLLGTKNWKTTGLTASLAASVLKDEIQARAWYPKMARDWTLTRHVDFQYEQFPGQTLEISTMDVITDHSGHERDRMRHSPFRFQVSDVNGIPESLARRLIEDPRVEQHRIFE